MSVDLDGPWYLSRGVLPTIREFGTGAIVNVGSVAASLPTPGEGAYAAAKPRCNPSPGHSLMRSVGRNQSQRGCA
jgi:short-subunit dehydrogenase